MFMIGIDPHKGSHTAAAVDRDEAVIGTLRVDADRDQRAVLLEWAARFEPRTWAVEGATGMGALLAQQLVAAGEHVVDVPPKLSARVRLMDTGRIDKTDPNDARSAAIVALAQPDVERRGAASTSTGSCCGCWPTATTRSPPTGRARSAGSTRVLCLLIEGGTGRALTADRAKKLLATVVLTSR